MTEVGIETMQLPLSGLRWQRRPDGRWRCVTASQYDAEQSGNHVHRPDEWTPAEAPIGTGARAQRAPGRGTGPSWWVLYGDARHGPVTVTLDDGQTPPIVFFEPLWICEWISPWQPAQVTVGENSLRAFANPVHY